LKPGSPSPIGRPTPVGTRGSGLSVNLPNALTFLRIVLVPVLVVVLITRMRNGTLIGGAIFGLAVLTDWLDGFLARRRNEVTRLGILLDPIADKLLISAAFLSLVELDAAPAWMVMIVLGREFLVTGFRNVALQRGLLIPASGLGKGKMVSQVVCIFLLLGSREYPLLRALAVAALWVVVLMAVVSAADYLVRFGREVLQGPRPETEKGPGMTPPGP
jgi:CDP-diacylglycerol---glycerol-3-phosphate 3-phosphatidyltransferase